MAELKFEVRQYRVDPTNTKQVNNSLLSDYKAQVTNELKPYIDKINAYRGYVSILAGKDGETFKYQLLGIKDHDLLAEIMDELYSK